MQYLNILEMELEINKMVHVLFNILLNSFHIKIQDFKMFIISIFSTIIFVQSLWTYLIIRKIEKYKFI